MNNTNLTTLSSKGPSRLPRGAFALLVTIVLLATLAVVDWAQHREINAMVQRMESFYLKPTLHVRKSLQEQYGLLHELSLSHTTMNRDSLAKFHEFAETSFANYPDVIAFAWMPRVEDPAFSKTLTQEFAADGLVIQAPVGSWQQEVFWPVGERTRFPVYYFRARLPELDLWGEDLGELPGFSQAMRQACDVGKPITIRPAEITALRDDPHCYVVLQPVYQSGGGTTVESRRNNLRGFCAEVFRFKPLATVGTELAAAR